MARRVITGTTEAGTGATYIPIDRYAENTTIHVFAEGTVTFTVDQTLDNIVRAAANPTDISNSLVTPANAEWVELIASGSADAQYGPAELEAYAIRINITAGTGSVKFRIAQTG